MTTTPTTLSTLTEGTLTGNGIFDKLMASAKAHLDAELKKGTIKGPEYSQVYLGQVQAILQTATALMPQLAKLDLECAQLQAQTDLVNAQVDNAKLSDQLTLAQVDQIKAQTALATAQLDQTKAQTALVNQQLLNAQQELLNLQAQECLLKAQYDNTVQGTARTAQETALMAQKVVTEKAQTQALGVDDDSVIGKQKALYGAQTQGFFRDAEQKAAKLLTDTWSVRRTTDDGTVADSTNKLDDATIGRAIAVLLTGINA